MSSMGDLGAILVPLGATWGVSWSLLRPSWGYLERSWVVLGPSWGDVVPVGEAKNIVFPCVFFYVFCKSDFRKKNANVWPSWSDLEASWVALGPSWDRLGAVLGRLWAVLGIFGAVLGPHRRHECDLQSAR